MPLPIQTLAVNAFMGTEEGANRLLIADAFSSGGATNVWMDKAGRVRSIDGFVKQNTSQFATDTGANKSVYVKNIVPYVKQSGTTVTRHLLALVENRTLGASGGSEAEIWYSADSGATWTFLVDNATPLSSYYNFIMDGAQFGDNLYVTRSATASTLGVPQKWDGTSLTTAGRTQSPTPSAALGVAGNLTGNYQWKLLSLIGKTRQAGSVASTSLAMTADKATVTWTADTNASVTGYELYRTTATGSSFYFVDYIDGRLTATYTDNVTDLTILQNRTMQEHGDAPPAVFFCEPYKQRMWWGRTVTNPSRVYFSDPGLPEDVGTNNYLDFSEGSTWGDHLTGMLGDWNGQLLVFGEQAIWTVSGTGQVLQGIITDWNKNRTAAQIGSVSHRTAVRVPVGAVYTDPDGNKHTTTGDTVAYLTPIADIRLLDERGHDRVISTPVKTTLQTRNYQGRVFSYALLDIERSEIVWGFLTSTPAGADPVFAFVVWNYQWGVWYLRDWKMTTPTTTGANPSCGIIMESATAPALHIMGEADTGVNSTGTGNGLFWQMWSGNTLNGDPINATWMTKPLYPKDENGTPNYSDKHRWRWVDVLGFANASINITCSWFPATAANGATADGSVTLALTNGGLDQVLAKIKSTGGDHLLDEGIRLKFTSTTTAGHWGIEGFTAAFQSLPGRRGMQ